MNPDCLRNAKECEEEFEEETKPEDYLQHKMTDDPINDLNTLIALKHEWLKQAHNEHICKKIVIVTQIFGERIYYRHRENDPSYIFKKNGVILHSYIRSGLHIAGTIRNSYWHISVSGYIGEEKEENRVVYLRYTDTDERPDFAYDRPDYKEESIETTLYRFIPGKWVETLNKYYEQAQSIINARIANENKNRINMLAAQLLINPKLEV